MAISTEQFNYLANKDDIRAWRDEVNMKMDRVLTVVDGIAKKFGDHEVEHAANLAAHDRFEARISKLESASCFLSYNRIIQASRQGWFYFFV